MRRITSTARKVHHNLIKVSRIRPKDKEGENRTGRRKEMREKDNFHLECECTRSVFMKARTINNPELLRAPEEVARKEVFGSSLSSTYQYSTGEAIKHVFGIPLNKCS